MTFEAFPSVNWWHQSAGCGYIWTRTFKHSGPQLHIKGNSSGEMSQESTHKKKTSSSSRGAISKHQMVTDSSVQTSIITMGSCSPQTHRRDMCSASKGGIFFCGKTTLSNLRAAAETTASIWTCELRILHPRKMPSSVMKHECHVLPIKQQKKPSAINLSFFWCLLS